MKNHVTIYLWNGKTYIKWKFLRGSFDRQVFNGFQIESISAIGLDEVIIFVSKIIPREESKRASRKPTIRNHRASRNGPSATSGKADESLTDLS